MNNTTKGFALTEMLFALIWIAGAIGWIWNIVKVAGALSDPVSGMFILRCIGIIVAPLGCVLGYIPA